MQPTSLHFTIDKESAQARLDAFLAERTEWTRSRIASFIEQRAVMLNGKAAKKAGVKLKAGDEISVIEPPLAKASPVAQAIPLNIKFEDEHLIVIDKPAGMVVHPAAGNPDGTLVNALLHHCNDLAGIGGVLRPGIVHRIDKDTSGLLVVAKTERAHCALAKQFKAHSIGRRYLALVFGRPTPDEATIEGAIGRHPKDRKRFAVVRQGGKAAITHYRIVADFELVSLVRFRLETGRTHQIRVHSAHIGHPVVGDAVYARSRRVQHLPDKALAQILKTVHRQLLHAQSLRFVHPVTEETLAFSSKPPEDMQKVLTFLETKWRKRR